MGIFDRMGRVISGNLHALFDKLEDDRKLISLNLEEMGSALRAGQEDVVQAVASEKQMRQKSDALAADILRWEKRAELAMKAGDEGLAREALLQKRKVTEERERVEAMRADQRGVALKMRDELAKMRARLSELTLRKETLVQKAEAARSGVAPGPSGQGGAAFANFRRMEDAIVGKEAQGDAMVEVEEALGRGPSADALEARFRELEAGGGGGGGQASEVDEELLQLKKRIRVADG